jgi:hypothetical protein
MTLDLLGLVAGRPQMDDHFKDCLCQPHPGHLPPVIESER